MKVQGSGSVDTVRSYTRSVFNFLVETDCPPLETIDEAMISAFLDSFASKGAAKHAHLKGLRSFLGWCVRHHLIEEDPTADIHMKKPRRKKPVSLTAEELERLIGEARRQGGERRAAAILLVYLLGLRRKEGVGLRWEDIREGETGRVIEINSTKGADQRDPLPLEPAALAALEVLRGAPRPHQAQRPPEFIIGVDRAAFSGWVHSAGVAAGLPQIKVRAHRLRSTLATSLLKSGVDVTVVQKILGHLRLESTAWYITEAEEWEVRAALAKAPVPKTA